jgi:hypothetical protein
MPSGVPPSIIYMLIIRILRLDCATTNLRSPYTILNKRKFCHFIHNPSVYPSFPLHTIINLCWVHAILREIGLLTYIFIWSDEFMNSSMLERGLVPCAPTSLARVSCILEHGLINRAPTSLSRVSWMLERGFVNRAPTSVPLRLS